MKEIIEFPNEGNVFSNGANLQNNFAQFLQHRKELRKSKMLIEVKGPSFRDNAERKEILRRNFVDRALSYIGVPYSTKFLQESDPLKSSHLSLDCCGLVRQCVNDLKEDFGFMLGGWNQAYQFDILPKEELSFDQMQPGDLIFYSAIYYPHKKWRPQLHDMVHVEIFLGGDNTPERTVASRSREGTVEINDTYKFVSENYYDIQYHFKSLDTWLGGIHKSFCDEHEWNDHLLEFNPNKYSLFHVEEGACENAEEAMEN